MSTRRTARIGLVLAAVSAACGSPATVERRWVVMGTYASVEAHADDEATAVQAIDEIHRVFERVDASMSNWKASSELSLLNREAGKGAHVVRDPDLFRCVALALDLARRTAGAFDPTVGPLMRLYGFRPRSPRIPTTVEVAEAARHVDWRKVILDRKAHSIRFADAAVELDLGGIAKGYALDLVVPVLERSGCRGALVDLGGQLYAWRRAPGGAVFTVALRDPMAETRSMATLDIANRSLSTSANYENSFTLDGGTIGHLMDAATGRPAESDVVAATVVMERAAEADALSTALCVAGSRRTAEILARVPRAEAVLLVRAEGGSVLLVSRSLEGKLRVEPEFLGRIGGRVRYVLPPSS